MIPVGRATELASFYDRVSDPLTAVEKLGDFFHKSNMFGCDRQGQGQVLALACFCERRNPIELAAKYHLIDGRLSAKADWMRAEFRRRGGRYKVLEASATACRIEWHWEGETIVESFTLDEAKQAKLVKGGGGWEKNPSDMLFARCTSRFMRRYAPEISGGAYTPEEIEDLRGDAGMVNSEAAVEVRRQQLAEEAGETVPFDPGHPVAGVAPGQVIDAEFTVTASAASPATADDPTAPPAPASDEQHAEVVRLGRECGLAGPQIKAGIIRKFSLTDPGPGKRPLITADQADEMIADFRKVIKDAKKRSAATVN